MCLIIAPGKDGKPALLPEDVYKFAYSRNNDGFGAMWTENGKVEHVKVLDMKQDDQYKYMQELVEQHPDVVFHMRLKTHGATIPSLCHPFRILHRNRHGKDLFFMHNGILSTYGKELTYGQSDTTAFKDKILVPLLTRNPDALDDPAIWEELNKITAGSRLIFMDSTGKTWRTSESSWNDRYGLTLSNTYMLPQQTYVSQYGGTRSYNPVDDDSLWTNDDDSNVYTLGTGKPLARVPESDKGKYGLWREIKLQDASRRGSWFRVVTPGILRSEYGSLYYDRGNGVVLDPVKDYISKDMEVSVIMAWTEKNNTLYKATTPTPPKEVDLDDEPFPVKDGVKQDTQVPADVEERLRYARLVHNCHGSLIADRKQMIADMLGMGNKELSGFVKEDPENAEIVMAELLEIIFEMNEVLLKDPTCEELCYNTDELLELNDPAHHQQAMKLISDKRKAYYAMLANQVAEMEEEKRNERVVA